MSRIARHNSKARVNQSISREELAKFLSGLGNLYFSKTLGNVSLSKALRALADCVREGRIYEVEGGQKEWRVKTDGSDIDMESLKILSADDVRKILEDHRQTKSSLLQLAAARFSMPVSQLSKMRMEDVRQSIRNALLHEASIEIISEEAGKEGAKRTS